MRGGGGGRRGAKPLGCYGHVIWQLKSDTCTSGHGFQGHFSSPGFSAPILKSKWHTFVHQAQYLPLPKNDETLYQRRRRPLADQRRRRRRLILAQLRRLRRNQRTFLQKLQGLDPTRPGQSSATPLWCNSFFWYLYLWKTKESVTVDKDLTDKRYLIFFRFLPWFCFRQEQEENLWNLTVV